LGEPGDLGEKRIRGAKTNPLHKHSYFIISSRALLLAFSQRATTLRGKKKKRRHRAPSGKDAPYSRRKEESERSTKGSLLQKTFRKRLIKSQHILPTHRAGTATAIKENFPVTRYSDCHITLERVKKRGGENMKITTSSLLGKPKPSELRKALIGDKRGTPVRKKKKTREEKRPGSRHPDSGTNYKRPEREGGKALKLVENKKKKYKKSAPPACLLSRSANKTVTGSRLYSGEAPTGGSGLVKEKEGKGKRRGMCTQRPPRRLQTTSAWTTAIRGVI